MKENYEKIYNDLISATNDFDWLDIVNSIELSNYIKNKNLGKLQDMFDNGIVNDGINTFGLFIISCIEKYKNTEYYSIYEFIDKQLENCIEDFVNKYYYEEQNIKEKQAVYVLTQNGVWDYEEQPETVLVFKDFESAKKSFDKFVNLAKEDMNSFIDIEETEIETNFDFKNENLEFSIYQNGYYTSQHCNINLRKFEI